MEWNDSLDEISDFGEELRSCAEDSLSDPDSELSSSPSATYDNGDDSDFGAGPSAPNKGGRKKPKAKSKQRAGNINRRTKKSKQPNVSLSTCEVPSTRNSNKNKNTKKHQANRGGNQKKKATKMLTKKELDEVMMKLEGKRPMCWNFVSEQLSKQPVMKHLENHRKLIEEILEVGSHVFGLCGTFICSFRGSKEGPQSSFDIALNEHSNELIGRFITKFRGMYSSVYLLV